MSSEWFFIGPHCWQSVNPTYYFLWIFLWFLTQHPNPTSQRPPIAMAKQVFKNYGVGGTLPSPAHLHLGERQDLPWYFMSRHVEWMITPHISLHWGDGATRVVTGALSSLQDANKEPILWKEMFPNCKFLQHFLLWGGRATEDNKTCLAIPSWSKKKAQVDFPGPYKWKTWLHRKRLRNGFKLYLQPGLLQVRQFS